MSERVGERAAGAITGVGGLVVSITYIAMARGIEDSLLADPVGASGVPVAVGGLMALASAGLLVKAALAGRSPETAPQDKPSSARPHLLALGLLVILSVYLLVLPWLGYVVAVGLMAAAVAWWSGGRQPAVLAGFAVCTGPILWLLFDFALRIRMPAGIWRSLFQAV